MEKLSINKLGKKLLLPLMAAGMLNCAVASGTFNNNKTATLKNQTTVQYQTAEINFSEAKSFSNFKNIVESDLNAMTGYDKLEAKVQNEVVGYMTDVAADAIATSKIYETREHHTLADANMSIDHIAQISQNRGKGTSKQENIVVAGAQIQHYAHLGLATKSLVLFGADEAELHNADELDKKNEFFTFSVKGKRDVRNETSAVISNLEVKILNYVNYAYAVNGQDGTTAVTLLKQDFANLKTLLNKKGKLSQQDYRNAINLINHAADILSSTHIFGNKNMCRALIAEIAKTYAMNNLLTHLENLGYNIDNFKAGNFIKENNRDITFNPSVTGTATNKHIGTNLGFAVDLPLSRNWDLNVGGELGMNKGINGGNNSIQMLGTSEVGYTTDNGKHRFGAGLKAGLQRDTEGWSTPFGVTTGYTYKFNDKFSMVWGASDLVNVQRKTNDAMAHMSAVIRTGKINLIFTLAGGYTHTWEKDSSVRSNSINPTPIDPTPTPTPTPTEPTTTYGTDEGVTPQPGAVDQGTDHPDIPIEISHY